MKSFYPVGSKCAVKRAVKKNINSKRGRMNREDIKPIISKEEKPVKYEAILPCDDMHFGIDVLTKMYTIHSPSGWEGKLGLYIQELLDSIGVKYTVGNKGEIYNIKAGLPLLCAHTDQVQRTKCTHTVQYNNYIYGMCGHKQAGLGADDKNGVWIVLNLVKKFGDKVSFLFSTMEEVGGMTDKFMEDLGKETTESIPYALIFDRKGAGDIIGMHNEYCMIDLWEDVAICGSVFGYSHARGVWSDCDHISNHVPCVNLSCGYWRVHQHQ